MPNKIIKSFIIFSLIIGITILITIALSSAISCGPTNKLLINIKPNQDPLPTTKICLDQACSYSLVADNFNIYLDEKNTNSTTDIGFLSVASGGIELNLKDLDELPEIQQNNFTNALEKLVQADLSSIKPLINQEINLWKKANDDYKYHYRTKIFPYEKNKELELTKNKNNLFQCYYNDYQKADDYLFTKVAIRDYCHTYCGGSNINYHKFFVFLLFNINKTTLPYTASLIIIIIAITILIKNLIIKKELSSFFKPRTITVATTIFVAFYHTVTNRMPSLEIILFHATLAYFITSLIVYSITKIINRNK